MRRSQRLILTLALAGSVAGASAPAAWAGQFGGFSVRPEQFSPNDPATRAYFKPTVAPGAGFTGDVVVTDSGSAPITLLVYPVDGLTGTTTGSVYGDRGDPLRKAGRWLTPATRRISLTPGMTELVPFTVRVPLGARPGDHLAGIAFQNARPRRTPGRFSVTEIMRVVVGVEIRVPGPAGPAIALFGARLRALPGTPVASLIVQLANRGSLICQPRLTASLDGAGRTEQVTRQLRTVLPGDAIPYPFAWPTAIAPGRYRVRVLATSCGAPAALTRMVSTGVPLAGDGRPWVPGSSAPPSGGVPILLLSIIGIGGLLSGVVMAGGAFALRRRRLRPS